MRLGCVITLLVLGATICSSQAQWVIVESFKSASDCSRPDLVASYEAYRPDACVVWNQQTGTNGANPFRKYSCTPNGIETVICSNIECTNCTSAPTIPLQQCVSRSSATRFPFTAASDDVYQFDFLTLRCGELPAGAQGLSIQDHYAGCQGPARSRTFMNVGAQCSTRTSGESPLVSTYSARAECGNEIVYSRCLGTTCTDNCITERVKAGECTSAGFKYFCGSATVSEASSQLVAASLLLASTLVAMLI